MLDGQTILLIFLVFILLFGTKQVPELARSLGKAYGEFKKAEIESEEARRLEPPIKEMSQHIIKLAKDLGISTEGKDDNLLLDEIKATIKAKNRGIVEPLKE